MWSNMRTLSREAVFVVLACLKFTNANPGRQMLAYDKANFNSDLEKLGLSSGDVNCPEVTGAPPIPSNSGSGRGGLSCAEFYAAVAKIPEIQEKGLTAGCPPPGFDALADFSPEAYISRPWYIQQQQPNSYQQNYELNCVRAKYTAKNPNNVTEGIIVQNYSVLGGVNGTNISGTSGIGDARIVLAARIYDPKQPSKLSVGPAFPGFSLPRSAFGDYWVVAAGNSKNLTASQEGFPGYDWAIVTGGPPRTKSGEGCITGSPFPEVAAKQTNGIGFWLFTREPVADQATIAEMRRVAEGLGLDTSVLVDVNQEGCTYKGADAPIPPSAYQVIIA